MVSAALLFQPVFTVAEGSQFANQKTLANDAKRPGLKLEGKPGGVAFFDARIRRAQVLEQVLLDVFAFADVNPPRGVEDSVQPGRIGGVSLDGACREGKPVGLCERHE